MRSHVKVYFDFEIKAKELTEEEKGRLLLGMLRYAKEGSEPEMTGNERFLFPVFKAQIDEDIKVYDTKVANGSRGGRPVSAVKPEETGRNRNKPEETENNLTEPKITEIAKKEERRYKKEEQEKGILFEKFWEAYPKRVAKAAARVEFVKLKPTEELLATMLEAIGKQKESAQWKEAGGQYIPYPKTWLHNRRWEDDLPAASDQKAGQAVGKILPAQQYTQRDYSGFAEDADDALERAAQYMG